MGTLGRRTAVAATALALSVVSVGGATLLANGPLAVLGGLALIVALLALNRVPRDRGW